MVPNKELRGGQGRTAADVFATAVGSIIVGVLVVGAIAALFLLGDVKWR